MTHQNNDRDAAKIVIIGLDACDVDLMLRFSSEGRMPFLTSLMKSNTFGRLISTRGMFSDSPWPSLNAGVTPAKHAFYNYLQMKRGTTSIERIDAHHCRYLPFWSRLRGSGKKVAAIDVPKTFPIEGVDGVQLSAWGEHYPLLKSPASIPPDYLGEVIRRYGRYPHPDEVVVPRSVRQERRLYRTMCSNIDSKCRVTLDLLQREDWDLFISVFSEVHYAGHQFYHHFEKSHWAHQPAAPADLAEMLPDLHARLDAAVASVFQQLSDNTTFFVVSVHGFATNYSANHLMPTVLEKLGFSAAPAKPAPPQGIAKILQWTRGLRGLIPASVRAFINTHLVPDSTHDQVYSHAFSNHVDWTKTKAVFLPSDHFQAFLSVNLKDREPMGIVNPGAEYEQVCDDLCRELKGLINPRTGKPAVTKVIRTSDMYQGPNLLELPDLVVQWAEGAPIEQLSHPKFGVITDTTHVLRRTQHSSEGFLIAGGPHINTRAGISGAEAIDFAPTILYLLGQPIPGDMDGRVLLELIDGDFKRRHEPRYAGPSGATRERSAAGATTV